MSLGRYGFLIAAVSLSLQAGAAKETTVSITLNERSACVLPHTKHFARTEGGFVDAQVTDTGALVANLSACAAANAYLAHTGMAMVTLELEQQFEITSADPQVSNCTLTLDSTLVGYVRSKHRATACVRDTTISLTPLDGGASLIAKAYPEWCASGNDGRLCNQRLAPVVVPNVPLGKFVLSAHMVIEAQAGGLYDAHAAADFSPSASLPPDFVRLRDPFQNADKKNFGLTIMLKATSSGPIPPRVSRSVPLARRKKENPVSVKPVTGAGVERAKAIEFR